MKRRVIRPVRLAIVVCLAVAVIVVLAAVAGLGERIGEFIYSTRVRSGSSGVLIGTENLAELETIAVIRRTVFPHDFFLADTSRYDLVRKIAESDASAEEALTDDELLHFQAANLAERLGLARAEDQRRFVVVTSELRYGYRMGELNRVLEERECVPDAELLSIRTADIAPERYPYTPVYLDADGWRTVSEFVSRVWRTRPAEPETITRAGQAGADLVGALLAGERGPARVHACE